MEPLPDRADQRRQRTAGGASPGGPGLALGGSARRSDQHGLPGQQARDRVGVVLLGVPGIGVAAVTTVCVGVAAGGLVVTLVHGRLVLLVGSRAVRAARLAVAAGLRWRAAWLAAGGLPLRRAAWLATGGLPLGRLAAVPAGMRTRADARVLLVDLGVVGGIRVAALGIGVATVTAAGVAAAGRGVATFGLRLVVTSAEGRLPVAD